MYATVSLGEGEPHPVVTVPVGRRAGHRRQGGRLRRNRQGPLRAARRDGRSRSATARWRSAPALQAGERVVVKGAFLAEVGTAQVADARRTDVGGIERFVAAALRQRLFVLLCLAALVATGVAAYRELPVEAFPDLTNNQVVVVTDAPGSRGHRGRAARLVPDRDGGDGRARRRAGAVDLQAGALDRQHRVRRRGAGVLRAAAGRRAAARGARPDSRRPRADARPGGHGVRRDLPVPRRRRRGRRDGRRRRCTTGRCGRGSARCPA